MNELNLRWRVADSKSKRRQDNGRWSQDLYIQVRSPSGGRWVGWAALTFSKQEGYGIIYDGDRPEIARYLESVCDRGMLFLLDELVNGKSEQSCDQTDAQLGNDGDA